MSRSSGHEHRTPSGPGSPSAVWAGQEPEGPVEQADRRGPNTEYASRGACGDAGSGLPSGAPDPRSRAFAPVARALARGMFAGSGSPEGARPHGRASGSTSLVTARTARESCGRVDRGRALPCRQRRRRPAARAVRIATSNNAMCWQTPCRGSQWSHLSMAVPPSPHPTGGLRCFHGHAPWEKALSPCLHAIVSSPRSPFSP
jgi:hypothetical protein